MGQAHGQVDVLTDGDAVGLRFAVIDGDRQGGFGFAGGGTFVFDAQGQVDLFVQDGEGGGVLDDKAAVPVGVSPCQQQVQGGGQRRGKWQGPEMDTPAANLIGSRGTGRRRSPFWTLV